MDVEVGVESWSNWAGNQSCSPRGWLRPFGRAELQERVAEATSQGRRITVPGSGHSFTAAAVGDDLMLNVCHLSGVLDADLETGLVKVGGGTVLADLNRELDRLGLAMVNLGDIDQQTIAGAISTGTHGTGASMPNLPAQVVAIDLVTADGGLLELDGTASGNRKARASKREQTDREGDGGDDEADLLRAARIAIGSLGVITAVTLQTVPAFNLHRADLPMPLDEVLADFDGLVTGNEHFEFFVFPYTDTALTIRRNRTARRPKPRGRFERFLGDVVIENGLGDLALRATGRIPGVIPKTARFSTRFMSQAEQIDVSHRCFANYRTIRFNEMEYAVPRENGPEALARVLDLIKQEKMPLAMPIECRVVAADDSLIGPVSGRDSTYIAVHQHSTLEWQPYFREIERIFSSYGGRPHWGKHHFQTAETLAPRYPGWQKFAEIRDRLDPKRTFTNEYVKTVLGE
jgi:FAD/FMN-containing dehydrogenase